MNDLTTIRAANVPAIIDALAVELEHSRTMEEYYKGQVDKLAAENAAQAEEIKRLKGSSSENACRVEP